MMARCNFCGRRLTLGADERGRAECRRCLRARIAKLQMDYAEEFGIPAEEVTVKVDARKCIEHEPTRHVVRYWLPDGRTGYCDPMGGAATMSLPEYTPDGLVD